MTRRELLKRSARFCHSHEAIPHCVYFALVAIESGHFYGIMALVCLVVTLAAKFEDTL